MIEFQHSFYEVNFMQMTAAEKYAERVQIIEDAVALKEPARVPNGVRVSAFPYYEYGVTIREAMTDYQKAVDAYIRYHREFQPDTACGFASQASAKVFELLGVKTWRWPGNGLDDNNVMQFIEFPTLEEEEYEEFFADPVGFAYRKWLPRVYDIFEPFTKINYYDLMTSTYRSTVDAFTSPELLDTYARLLELKKENDTFRHFSRICDRALMDEGFPPIAGGGSITAFDMVADGLRGTFGMMSDLMTQPEKIKKCCEMFIDLHIKKSLDSFKMTGLKYQWVMLHKGFDKFISDEMYAEYYWPYLRQWVERLVEEGIVPVLFCEGAYNTRLKYLAEVPKGKVICLFEDIDIREAKRILGGVACIMGGFPAFTVTHGTPEKIRDQVKEYMDVLAPGGGFIFSLGSALDKAPRANVEVLFEAIELFGKK